MAIETRLENPLLADRKKLDIIPDIHAQAPWSAAARNVECVMPRLPRSAMRLSLGWREQAEQ
jgi:hypothetical protein